MSDWDKFLWSELKRLRTGQLMPNLLYAVALIRICQKRHWLPGSGD